MVDTGKKFQNHLFVLNCRRMRGRVVWMGIGTDAATQIFIPVEFFNFPHLFTSRGVLCQKFSRSNSLYCVLHSQCSCYTRDIIYRMCADCFIHEMDRFRFSFNFKCAILCFHLFEVSDDYPIVGECLASRSTSAFLKVAVTTLTSLKVGHIACFNFL